VKHPAARAISAAGVRFTAGVMLAGALSACADPPDPPPATPTASAARWMEWRDASALVDRPIVVVVDVPGGPADRVVADGDVTTFFNDRFHPVLVSSLASQPVGTVRFYDACGCPLTDPIRPATPQALIAAANAVIVLPQAHRCTDAPHPLPGLGEVAECAQTPAAGL
jgi:hypothetical protein